MKKHLFLLLFIVSLGYGARGQSQCMCVQLDGINEYLHTNYNNYNFTNFTIELWINVPRYTSNIHYVSMHQNAYLVLGNYDVGALSTWADGLNPIDAGPSSMISTINVWHHVAFTYDGSAQKIYIDGVLDRNRPTSGNVTMNVGMFAQGLNIGARHDGSVQYVEGMLDEVRVWNVARTQTEIQSTMMQELVGNEPGLVNYWPMNDGPGSTIASDVTVNNNDVTLTNMEPNTDWVGQCPFMTVPPFVLNVAASDTICAGDTLMLSVSGRDSVIWTPNAFLNVDTGNVVLFYPATSGSVTILGWRNGSLIPDTLVVDVLVLPSQHTTTTTSICAGDSVFAGGAWQMNSGTFVDAFTNVQGCDSVITTVLTVHPVFTTSASATICNGDSILLGGSFQTAAGNYTDLLSTVHGCDSLVTTTLAVTTVDTSVTVLANVLTANASPATYEWFDCNALTIVLGTDSSFTPVVSGQYLVEVTQNGCTAQSGCYSVVLEAVNGNALQNGVTLYPNPARDEVFIAFQFAHEGGTYALIDELGRVVRKGEISEGVQKASIPLASLTRGIYFVQIRIGETLGAFRFVKE